MICVAAMLPLYKRIGMSPLIMALSNDVCERHHEPKRHGVDQQHVLQRHCMSILNDVFVPMIFTNARCNWVVILPGFMHGRRFYVWPYGA